MHPALKTVTAARAAAVPTVVARTARAAAALEGE